MDKTKHIKRPVDRKHNETTKKHTGLEGASMAKYQFELVQFTDHAGKCPHSQTNGRQSYPTALRLAIPRIAFSTSHLDKTAPSGMRRKGTLSSSTIVEARVGKLVYMFVKTP